MPSARESSATHSRYLWLHIVTGATLFLVVVQPALDDGIRGAIMEGKYIPFLSGLYAGIAFTIVMFQILAALDSFPSNR